MLRYVMLCYEIIYRRTTTTTKSSKIESNDFKNPQLRNLRQLSFLKILLVFIYDKNNHK